MQIKTTILRALVSFKNLFHSSTRQQSDNRKTFRKSGYTMFICMASLFLFAQVSTAQILWSSAGGSAWLTGSNWTGSNVPTSTDIAQFGVNPTAATGVGINFNSATNDGTQTTGNRIEDVGAVEVTSARAAAFLIGNSSSTSGATGTLKLFGATVNSISNTILRNNSNQTFTIQNIQSSGTQTMGVVLGNATDNVVNVDGTGNIVISSGISGNNHLTLNISNTGDFRLSGSNSFTGGITVNASSTGRLRIDAVASMPTSGTLRINTAGVMRFNVAGTYGGLSQALEFNPNQIATPSLDINFTGNATWQGTVNFLADTRIEPSGSGNSITFSGNATGSGAIIKQAAGTLILSGIGNNLTGNTSIGNGALTVNSGSSMGTGSLTLAQTGTNATTINLNNAAQTISSLASTWTATTGTIVQTVNLGSGHTLTINQVSNTTFGTGAVSTLASILAGSGNVIKTGAGILTLTSANTYTGSTTISNGELRFNPSANTTLGSVALNGGTLGTSGISASRKISFTTLSLANSSTIDLNTSTVDTISFSASNGITWTPGKTITITGWQGGYNGTTGTSGKIFVGTNNGGLTGGQLSQIIFKDGSNVSYPAAILSTGEVVAAANCVAPSITSVTSNGAICANETLNLNVATSGTATLSYAWTGTGNFSSTTVSNPSVTNAATGYYSVIVSNACGSDTDSVSVTVNPNVTPTIGLGTSSGTTICSGTPVTFTANITNGGSNPNYDFRINNVSVQNGATATYTTSSLANGDSVTCTLTSNANCASPSVITSSAVYMTMNPVVTPSVSLVATPSSTICSATNVTFTVTPENGGLAPAYEFFLNNTSVQNSSSNSYSSNTLSNGDSVYCVMTSNAACTLTSTANSNTVNIVVSSTVTPTISISANPGSTICAGTSVAVTATAVNGGSSPNYNFMLNNVSVQNGSSNIYFNSSLSDGDSITCTLTSNDGCASPLIVTSSAITFIVNPTVVPSVSISANPGTTICAGTSVSFTANAINGGGSPNYNFKVNNVSAQNSSSDTFTTTSLSDGDSVTCELSSNATCASPSVISSAAVYMTVNPSVTPTISISANPGSTICSGTSVTFTASATNTGSAPNYNFKINNTSVQNGTGNSYTTSSLADGDSVTCELTSNATCASPATVSSVAVYMVVNPIVTPSVSIVANPGSSICAGTSVTFTATAINGGAAPNYNFMINNVSVQSSSSNTYSTSILADGDSVTCELTSNASCISSSVVTSSAIYMMVTATVVPSVSISANPGSTICSGVSVTFTATTMNGGITPSYNFKKNNLSVQSGTNNTYTTTTLANGDSVTCTLTSNANCASPAVVTSAAVYMTVNPLPTVSISPASITILAGNSVTLTASGTSASYLWNDPGVSTSSSVSVSPATTTTYTVTGTGANGCVKNASATVTVVPAFAAGNLVVNRFGDGTTALTGNAAPVFLDQYNNSSAAQSSAASSYKFSLVSPRPSSSPFNLGESGSATSDGFMNVSSNGTFLCVPGYNAKPNEASITGSRADTLGRTIGIAYTNSTLTTPSTVNMLSANNYRGLISNGTSFWASGAGGIAYVSDSVSGSVTAINSGNARDIIIYNGNLYASTSSTSFNGSGSNLGVWKIGTSGLPTSSLAAASISNVINTGTGSSPYGFAFSPAGTTCYIADDRATAAGGIQKWTFNGTTWSLAYTLGTGVTNIGARGITVDFSGATPIIYATTAEGSANRLIKITDTGASAIASTLATAGTNKIFRGVSFTPVPTVTLNATSFNGAFGSITVGTSSSPSSFTVRGFVLQDSILITSPSSDFEIKKSSDPVSAFSSNPIKLAPVNGVVTETSIDVRFKPSVTDSSNGYISISTLHAPTQILAVSGFGTAAPTPTINLDLSGFNGSFGNIPVGYSSVPDTFTVSGSNLSSDIILYSPPGFQISLDNSAWISNPDSIILSQSGGNVSSTSVYVRFTPLTTGAASANIKCASNGATEQDAAVSGNGTPVPTNLKVTSVNSDFSPLVNQSFNIIIQSVDGSDVPQNVVANTDILISVNNGTGSLTGTITGTINAGTNTVTITGAQYSVAEGGVVLQASRTSGDALIAGNSSTFTVVPDVYPYQGGIYTQDFNSLSNNISTTFGASTNPFYVAGNPVNDTSMIGWQAGAQTGSTNFNFRSDNGGSTTGSVYSYGTNSTTDRAYGTLASSAMVPAIGWVMKNNTATSFTSFTINYVGEQWSNGGSGNPNVLSFSYQIGGTDILNGSYAGESSLNFQSPVNSSAGSPVSLNGNSPANRQLISATVNLPANWEPGQTLVVRWADANDNGSDDGLAVDSFSFVANAPAAPLNQDSTITFSSVSSTSMTANWLNGDGAGRIVIVNTSNSFTNPANGTDPTANSVYSGTGEQVVYKGSGSTVNVSGLSAGTNYFFRVFNYNGFGTSTVYNTSTANGNPNNQFTISSTPPVQLAITSVNGGASPVVNNPFAVTVQSQDGSGNPQNVADNTEVELYVFNGSGNLDGTITGTIIAGTNTIIINGVEYDTEDIGVQLGVSVSAGDVLTDGTSAAFDVLGVASQLTFTNVPNAAIVDSLLAPFQVQALRDDATLDVNYSGDISVSVFSGPGNILGTLTKTAVNGVATFNDIRFDQAGIYVLEADASGLASALSHSITITSDPVMTELVVPKYIGSKSASSANTTRTPFAVCVKIDNLVPSTAYDLKLSVGLTSENDSVYGAGNIWTGSSFSGSTVNNAFTTDATGSSGPYWIYVQPTGNGTRFDAGQTHNIRVGIVTHGGTIPAKPNFRGNKTITALDIATPARSASTADDGAFIKGTSVACAGGKFVLVYDNVTGSGDPLFAYQIRQTIPSDTASADNSGLPLAIRDVYRQNGTSSAGDYIAVVPTNNSNGVRRIEARNADNTIFNFATDADGVWASGANTINPSRLSVTTITVTDASLNTVSVNATPGQDICNGSSNGTAMANATGAGSISYSWNSSPVQTTPTAINLTPGTYQVTATDANSCSANASATIGTLARPTALISGDTTICNGGTAILNIAVGGVGPWNGHLSDGTAFSGNASPMSVSVSPSSTTAYTVSDLSDANCIAEAGDLTGGATITVNSCSVTLHLKLFIEGLYIGGGQMRPVLYSAGLSSDANACDSITVELHDQVSPYGITTDPVNAILMTNGNADVSFPGTINNNSYYIMVKHRNSIETWSKNPVLFNNSDVIFDLTTP